MHFPHRMSWSSQPAFVPVECRHAVSVGRVRERHSLVWILRENVDRDIPVTESDRPFHHAARDFLNCSSAANRLQILVEELISRRPARFLSRLWAVRFLGLLRFTRARRGFRHYQWRPDRSGAAPMAGIASHLAMSLEVILINSEHHLHHFPRGLLRFLVVLLKRALHMAKLA